MASCGPVTIRATTSDTTLKEGDGLMLIEQGQEEKRCFLRFASVRQTMAGL